MGDLRLKGLLAALPEQPLFEALLADLAARFANAQPGEVATQIERALAQLVDLFGYDRCTYSEFADDARLVVLSSAAAAGLAPLPRGCFDEGLAWFLDELRAGRVVAMPRLPDGLPPEAHAEAEHCRRIGLRSHLSIPLSARGRVAGVLSLGGLRSAQQWSADTITRLTILGELFSANLERARSEEEMQRLRLRLWHADRVARLGTLSAAIAHEINQPLAAILANAQAGLAYLARGEATPAAMREILEAVVRDDRRAADTIRTMRAFLRRDERGRERIDLAAAMRDVLQLLASELARKGIAVEARLEPGCWVRADKAQIEQVALNLVLNALAAMEGCAPGERRLRLSAARLADGRVAAEVRDSGRGIAPENMARLFDPFWTTRKEGLGLGLAICRSIMEAHGGSIHAERNAERGATFRIHLRAEAAAQAHEAGAAPAPSQPLSAQERSGAPLVCIVDDDAAVREGVAARLAAEGGWRVAGYGSAEELLAGTGAQEAACLVLDLHMPGLSGLALQEKLAAARGTPPIVFLTGGGDVAASVTAMKRGAVDFLAKPVDDDKLLDAVRRAIELHAARRGRALEREASLERFNRLSSRERQVMAEVVRGRLNKQIAADLDIALQTVKQHRARVMEKMEAASVAELVRAYEASGLFSPRAP